MISSRKQDKVSKTVSQLEEEEQGCAVRGVVCHVAKHDQRKNLIEQVRVSLEVYLKYNLHMKLSCSGISSIPCLVLGPLSVFHPNLVRLGYVTETNSP